MNAQAPALSLASDLLTGTEWNAAQVRELFRMSADIKAHPDRYHSALAGRFVAMIFEKPSLRTRVTFEVGVASLGGTAVFLDHTLTHLGERECVRDIAKNLERWVHGIVARVFAQESLEDFAKNASIPVINALSDKYHPCQALADFFTLEERFGNLRGAVASCSGDNLEALVGKRPHKQGGQNALAANACCQFLKRGIFKNTARVGGRLGEDGEGKVAIFISSVRKHGCSPLSGWVVRVGS